MQTGSVLTLNFYSNPIDVMIGDDQTIYLNWKHYCDMISNDPEIAPHNITRGEFDVDYVAFSYVVLHADNLVYGHPDPLFANLVRDEFPGYIIKELGLIREMIPMIDLPYHMYDSGVFQHNGKLFVLVDKLKRFTNQIEPNIPLDTPRFPIMVKVQMPRTGFVAFGERPKKDEMAYPTWMVEANSLAYIIESSYRNHPTFQVMTNRMEHAIKVNKGFDIESLGPAQRFDSPGVVGTHHCELDPEQVQAVQARDALMKSSRWEEPMTWAGSGLKLKPEL